MWVGAWWIGFLAAAVVCFVIAIPLLAFPAALPGKKNTLFKFKNIISLLLINNWLQFTHAK